MSLIANLESKILALKTKGETILKASETAGTLSKEDSESLRTMKAEIADYEAQVKLIKETEDGLKGPGRKTPVTNPAAHIPEIKRYSLLKAIRAKVAGKELDGFEAEVNQEIQKVTGREAKGFWMPTTVPVAPRVAAANLNTTTGSGLVENFTDTANFIDLLRSKSVLAQAGARYVNDLVGEVDLPRQSAGATAYWVTEDTDITQGSITVGQVTLRAKSVGAYVDITRKMMSQTSMSMENLVRDDLAASISLAIQKVAIAGGAAGEPSGILNLSDVTQYQGLGAGFGWEDVVGLETIVASGNADLGSLAYLTNPAVRGLMKTTAKATNQAIFLWGDNNQVNGYPGYATTGVANGLGTSGSPLIFGNFNDLIIGTWGALDVVVDPISLIKSGGIRVRAIQDVDVAIRNSASFAFCEILGV